MASEGEMFVVAVHVDDIVLATKSDERMAEVKKGLAEGFDGHGRAAPFPGCKGDSEPTDWRSVDRSRNLCPKSSSNRQLVVC